MTIRKLLKHASSIGFLIALVGCAATEWQNPDVTANLDQDRLDCTERAHDIFPKHYVNKRYVDNSATKRARANFRPAVSYDSNRTCTTRYGKRTCTYSRSRTVDSQPPTIYKTRRVDTNRSERSSHTRTCMSSKGWRRVKVSG